MRDDIFLRNPDGTYKLDREGNRLMSVPLAIGKGYSRGWFTNCRARYRIFEGARSTKKSYDMVGYEPLIKVVTDPNRNILVMRQNDVDNYQTTFTRIVKCINDLGWTDYFTIHTNPHEIIYKATGQKIIFRGLNNPTALNGLDFAVGYFTDTYIDEAYEVGDYEAFQKLDGTMRGKLPEGTFFQLTLCLNPWSQETWIYTEFFKGRLEDDYKTLDDPKVKYMDYYDPDYQGMFGKGLYLHKSTYKINEFRDENYDLGAMAMKEHAETVYKVHFLGMWGNTTESVYPDFRDDLIKPSRELVGRDKNGAPYKKYGAFAIGIDTGLSNGQGGKRSVRKDETVEQRVKSATTMQLCAITADFNQMVVIDEYFHSNIKAAYDLNTDNQNHMTQYELALACAQYIKRWIHIYGDDPTTMLMKGIIDVFVDSADIGFRDALNLELQRQSIRNVRLYASTKLPVQSRVDFEEVMMGWGDFLVSENCRNLVREIRNARRGEHGEAREDNDDHALTAMEYGMATILPNLKRYKTFMKHD